MIEKCLKVDYKQKCVRFENDKLLDENGDLIKLEDNLKKIFGDKEFTISAIYQKSDEFDVDDFDN